jgi:DNA-binding NarL/FixJ family response regulator
VKKGSLVKVFLVHDPNAVGDRLTGIISKLPSFEMVMESNESGKAFEKILINKPDVVIVDVQLRHGGGLNLIHRLSTCAPAPILIALASAASPLYRQKCMAAVAMYFFDKARNQDALVATLVGINR